MVELIQLSDDASDAQIEADNGRLRLTSQLMCAFRVRFAHFSDALSPLSIHLTLQVFLDHPAIKPTRTKARGITSHFSQSTGVDGLGALDNCQKSYLQGSGPRTLGPDRPPRLHP